MSDVPQRPRGANASLASIDRPRPLRAPRWEDPVEVRAWLAALRAVFLDANASGEDATRRLGDRVFSLAEARRRIEDAERAALAMFDTADADLAAREKTG